MGATCDDFKVGQVVRGREGVKWRKPMEIQAIEPPFLCFDIVTGWKGVERIRLLPADVEPTEELLRREVEELKLRVTELDHALRIARPHIEVFDEEDQRDLKIVEAALAQQPSADKSGEGE